MKLVKLDESRPLGKGPRLHVIRSDLPGAQFVLRWLAEKASSVWDTLVAANIRADLASKGVAVEFPKSNDARIPGTGWKPRKWYDSKEHALKFWVIYK